MPEYISSTLALIKVARFVMAKTWRGPSLEWPAWGDAKAGVVTNDLARLSHGPGPLVGALDRERAGSLMAAMDGGSSHSARGLRWAL
jgi:hypothetical protein